MILYNLNKCEAVLSNTCEVALVTSCRNNLSELRSLCVIRNVI